jgi:hypothetical protein
MSGMADSESQGTAGAATNGPRRSVRASPRLAAVATCLALLGTGSAFGMSAWREHEVRSQQELSRITGTFTPSRFLVYEGSDGRFHRFRERGKLGWLGPSATFRVPVSLIDLPGAVEGDRFVYDQNAGHFVMKSDRSSKRPDRTYATDFIERYTREEERFLKARAKLEALGPSGDAKSRIAASAEVMRASYWAGHHDETIAHARMLIAFGRAAVPDDLHAARILLGMIALERGDIETAKAELLASADVDASATLASFGPNMWLMNELLKAGETQVALDYLEACKAFWKSGADELIGWQAQIRAGRAPDFRGRASRFASVR